MEGKLLPTKSSIIDTTGPIHMPDTSRAAAAVQEFKLGNTSTAIAKMRVLPKTEKQPIVDTLFSSRSLEEPYPMGMTGFQSKNDIKYRGFTTKMKASDFLLLAKDRNYSVDTRISKNTDFVTALLNKVVSKEKPRIAPPFLKIDIDTDKKVITILGHEGRHRSDMIQHLFGKDVDIPVDINSITIKGSEARRSRLTDEMLDFKLINEDGKAIGKSFRDLMPENLQSKSLHTSK